MDTLPDYLEPGLDLVFVGINPGLYSAQYGHYFANLRNRFWAAFNLAEIAPVPFTPESDHACLRYRIGFTDLVKRPTRGMAELKPSEFALGAQVLRKKLLQYRPLMVCFNGVTAYRNFAKHTDVPPSETSPGLKSSLIGASRVWVLPSTSPANAGVPLDRIIGGMRDLKRLLLKIKGIAP